MKKMIALLLAAMMVLSMAACASKTAETAAPADTAEPAAAGTAAAADSDLAYIQDKGTLVIGITDFEPMDYKDADGSWIGFDADMAKAFAESLGVTAEFVEIDWDNKILELDSKTIDCVWNGMTLTAEVTSTMECSNAYCNNAQVVIVPADKASEYQTVESVKDLTFAAEAGSAGEAELTALGYTVTPVKAQSDALMEVAAGTSDAAVIDSLMAAAMVGGGHGLRQPDLHLRPQLRGIRRRLPQGLRSCPEAERVLPVQLRRRLHDADRRDLRRAGSHHRAEVIDTARDFR